MNESLHSRLKWMPLDNAAKIYPAVKNKRWTALFRLSMDLSEDIDPQILHRALQSTLQRFPGFAFRLRRGLFWFFLEHMSDTPPIQPDVANPCVRMNLNENKGFMFRVRYHNNNIALEIFHVLTDGMGGLCFLRTLVAEYLRIRYNADIPRSAQILDCSQPPSPEELEDSYLKYARIHAKMRQESPAYQIKGTKDDPHYMNITTGVLDASAVAARAKSYSVSVNVFLTAVLLLAVYKHQQQQPNRHNRKLPVRINVPVNLRQLYPTKTLRNFASYVNPGIDPTLGSYTLEETVEVVKHFMAMETTEKKLNAKFSSNVNLEQLRAMRFIPLFLKKPTMSLAFNIMGEKAYSCCISNLGNVVLPPEMSQYITRLDFMLGSLKHTNVTSACVSYNNKMYITFTRKIIESTIEKNFFTDLVKMGFHVTIESNQRDRHVILR